MLELISDTLGLTSLQGSLKPLTALQCVFPLDLSCFAWQYEAHSGMKLILGVTQNSWFHLNGRKQYASLIESNKLITLSHQTLFRYICSGVNATDATTTLSE